MQKFTTCQKKLSSTIELKYITKLFFLCFIDTIVCKFYLFFAMYDQFLPLLEAQGMSEKEALIYLVALELGSAPASTIARKTGIKRVTAYAILKEMERSHIATSINKWGMTYFQVLEPTRLLAKMQQNCDVFAEKVPELMALVQSYTTKPRVQYFEGFEGMKLMYDDLLISTQPIHSFLWTAASDPHFLNYLYDEFLPRRIQAGIFAQVLVSSHEKNLAYAEKDPSSLKETRIIAHPLFTIEVEIDLYGPGKVGFVLFSNDEMSWFIVHSQKLYESLLSIFLFLREGATQPVHLDK